MSTTRVTQLQELADCPCSGRNLDKLIQPAVLLILADGALHGYRIVQRLAEMSMFQGHPPDSTGVYRFLKAMEDRGMVTSAWDLSESGPAKRLFDLTPDGARCLRRWTATIEEYYSQVGELLRQLRQVGDGKKGKTCCCGGGGKSRARDGRAHAK